MAVDPTSFYISQTEIDARIDTLVSGLHTKIDAAALLLTEDSNGFVSVTSGSASQFNNNLNLIKNDFKWYKDLSNLGEVFRLKGAYADDYSYSAKECYILDKAEAQQ